MSFLFFNEITDATVELHDCVHLVGEIERRCPLYSQASALDIAKHTALCCRIWELRGQLANLAKQQTLIGV
jgi:hypothetical protein